MASSSIRNNMAHQVQAVLDGFNKWDYDALRATRSDDFIYQFLPLSLGAPPRNNDVYAAFFADVLTPLFDEFVLTPKTITHDPEARRSVMYAVVAIKSAVGAYEMELVMMLSFTETGEKVVRIDEFFDSAVYAGFFAKVQELQSQSGDQ